MSNSIPDGLRMLARSYQDGRSTGQEFTSDVLREVHAHVRREPGVTVGPDAERLRADCMLGVALTAEVPVSFLAQTVGCAGRGAIRDWMPWPGPTLTQLPARGTSMTWCSRGSRPAGPYRRGCWSWRRGPNRWRPDRGWPT